MKNFTIKHKLIFATSCLSFLLLLVGCGGLYSLYNNNKSLESVYKDNLLAFVDLDRVATNLLSNQLLLLESLDQSPEIIKEKGQQIIFNRADSDAAWKHYMSTYLTPKEKIFADKFVESRATYSKTAFRPILALIENNQFEEAKKMINVEMINTFVPLKDNMKELMNIQSEVAQQQYKNSNEFYNTFFYLVVSGIILGLIFAMFMTIWLIKSISNPLQKAVEIAHNVSKGDLTQTILVHSNDETGQLMTALKTMNSNLQDIVSKVRVGTDTIATASSQIASGNLDFSSRTEEQASSLEETASSMEELTSTVKQNSANAGEANRLAISASDIAAKGGEVVTAVIDKMTAINDSSRKIADIISVIDSIAFQTNILALNAAIEAARAGTAGRGFAVVATEVRNLAHKSATAAKEIKDLINDSVDKINTGSQLVNKAGLTMQDIVSSISNVTNIMSEITIASREQESGIEQINQAICEMDNVTQQNAALVEEAAAAAESLQEQASELAQLVSVFKV